MPIYDPQVGLQSACPDTAEGSIAVLREILTVLQDEVRPLYLEILEDIPDAATAGADDALALLSDEGVMTELAMLDRRMLEMMEADSRHIDTLRKVFMTLTRLRQLLNVELSDLELRLEPREYRLEVLMLSTQCGMLGRYMQKCLEIAMRDGVDLEAELGARTRQLASEVEFIKSLFAHRLPEDEWAALRRDEERLMGDLQLIEADRLTMLKDRLITYQARAEKFQALVARREHLLGAMSDSARQAAGVLLEDLARESASTLDTLQKQVELLEAR